jgi:hypothetical protein
VSHRAWVVRASIPVHRLWHDRRRHRQPWSPYSISNGKADQHPLSKPTSTSTLNAMPSMCRFHKQSTNNQPTPLPAGPPPDYSQATMSKDTLKSSEAGGGSTSRESAPLKQLSSSADNRLTHTSRQTNSSTTTTDSILAPTDHRLAVHPVRRSTYRPRIRLESASQTRNDAVYRDTGASTACSWSTHHALLSQPCR